jgi:hypothetical protein
MAAVRAELIEIDAKGVARPVGQAAARMQGLEGRFAIQPGPPELLLLRRVGAAKGERERVCALSGEIRCEERQASPRRISQRVKTVLEPIAPPAAGHVAEKPGK